MEQIIKEHTVHLEKGVLTITGINNVDSFDTKSVAAALASDAITVKGDGLTVVDLDIKSQNLVIKGSFQSITYGKKHEKLPLIKRIFK